MLVRRLRSAICNSDGQPLFVQGGDGVRNKVGNPVIYQILIKNAQEECLSFCNQSGSKVHIYVQSAADAQCTSVCRKHPMCPSRTSATASNTDPHSPLCSRWRERRPTAPPRAHFAPRCCRLFMTAAPSPLSGLGAKHWDGYGGINCASVHRAI